MSWPASRTVGAASGSPSTTVSADSRWAGSSPGLVSWSSGVVTVAGLPRCGRGWRARPALERRDLHAAADGDDVAGRVGHPLRGELDDGARDVGRGAPPRDRGEPVGELLVVLRLHTGRHVGRDHAGADLVDEDALGR